jgi:DNA-binding CsgD family transcriptional regulator
MTAAIVTKGELLLRTGQAERGIALLTAAEEMRVRSGWSLSPYEETEYASVIDRGREQLTSSEFDRAVAAGKALSMADIDAEMRSATPVTPVGTHKPGEAPDNSRGLTAREFDVLRLLIDGKTNPEIADDLFISERTVQTHVARILQKLGVSSRTAAATVAVRDQIV